MFKLALGLILAIFALVGCGVLSSQSQSSVLPHGTPTADRVLLQAPTRVLVPLTGNLVVSFREAGGVITLVLRSEEDYPSLSNEIDARLDVVGADTIRITIAGIRECFVCAAAVGPARQKLTLGTLSDSSLLIFRFPDREEVYRLELSPTALEIVSQSTNTQIVFKQKVWAR